MQYVGQGIIGVPFECSRRDAGFCRFQPGVELAGAFGNLLNVGFCAEHYTMVTCQFPHSPESPAAGPPQRRLAKCYRIGSTLFAGVNSKRGELDMRTKSFIAVLLLSGLPLIGQTLGDISGQVADPSGAGVPSSVVTLTNTATNAIRTAETNETGLYTFTSVPPGSYSLKV